MTATTKARAHRAAYALVVRPLGEAWKYERTPGSWEAFKQAAFEWYEEACFSARGTGRINRELRLTFGLQWSLLETLKARYSPRLMESILFDDGPSPFMALLPKPTYDFRAMDTWIVPIDYRTVAHEDDT